MSADRIPDWEQLHRDATVIDLHAHPSLKTSLFHQHLRQRYRGIKPFFWPLSVRTNFPALKEGGVDVLLSAIYAPEKRLLHDIPLLKWLHYIPLHPVRRAWKRLIEPTYFVVTNTLLDELKEQVEEHNRQKGASKGRPIKIARSVHDLDFFPNQDLDAPLVIVHTIEGSHSLEDTTGSESEILRNLEELHYRGVASLTLAHFYPNKTVMPTFPYPEFTLPILPQHHVEQLWADIDLTRGLTVTGERVVEKMIELGMLIDVSHCTPVARQRIYEIVGSQEKRSIVIATHVGSYTINPSPYNLEDWEIRWIADHGGVVGVIFMNYWLMPHETQLGLNFISRTIEQLIHAAGGRTDHVAIGTDFDGFTDPPDDLKDASELPRLTERLMAEMLSLSQRKYTDEDIRKIIGENALKVLREGWGKKT